MRKEYDFTNGKKNHYIKNEVKKFWDTHRDVEFSAAKFEYSIYLYGEASQKLGFRGDVSMISFLMEEAERMEKEYPNEYYDQGPVLAVQELSARCFS